MTLKLAKGAVEPQQSGVVDGNTFKPSKGAARQAFGSITDFVPRRTIAFRGVGQSNMGGVGTNPSPESFTPEEGLYLSATPTEEVWDNNGFSHPTGSAQNSPLFWFIREIINLTGNYVTATLTYRSGIPVTPGAGAAVEYWAPDSPDADPGQTSLMDAFGTNFEYFQNLNNTTRENEVLHNVVLVFESESDIFLLSEADPGITETIFRTQLDRWLNAMRGYGADVFAIIKPGRRGGSEGAVDAKKPYVDIIRGVYDDVIAANSDCFDVFPDLIEDPTPWVIDNLIVYDDTGAWVSGQANLVDGVHYTHDQYKAIGITAARNFYEQYLTGNLAKLSKGAVEPAETGASGNEYRAWKGAVEPLGALGGGLIGHNDPTLRHKDITLLHNDLSLRHNDVTLRHNR